MEKSIANVKRSSPNMSIAKVSKVNIANVKMGVNSANTVVNTLAVAVVNARVGNNNTDIENFLTIRVAGNCLKGIREIAI